MSIDDIYDLMQELHTMIQSTDKKLYDLESNLVEMEKEMKRRGHLYEDA